MELLSLTFELLLFLCHYLSHEDLYDLMHSCKPAYTIIKYYLIHRLTTFRQHGSSRTLVPFVRWCTKLCQIELDSETDNGYAEYFQALIEHNRLSLKIIHLAPAWHRFASVLRECDKLQVLRFFRKNMPYDQPHSPAFRFPRTVELVEIEMDNRFVFRLAKCQIRFLSLHFGSNTPSFRWPSQVAFCSRLKVLELNYHQNFKLPPGPVKVWDFQCLERLHIHDENPMILPCTKWPKLSCPSLTSWECRGGVGVEWKIAQETILHMPKLHSLHFSNVFVDRHPKPLHHTGLVSLSLRLASRWSGQIENLMQDLPNLTSLALLRFTFLSADTFWTQLFKAIPRLTTLTLQNIYWKGQEAHPPYFLPTPLETRQGRLTHLQLNCSPANEDLLLSHGFFSGALSGLVSVQARNLCSLTHHNWNHLPNFHLYLQSADEIHQLTEWIHTMNTNPRALPSRVSFQPLVLNPPPPKIVFVKPPAVL